MLSHVCSTYHFAHRCTQLFQASGIEWKAEHVQRVVKLFKDFPDLFISPEMDPELTLICAEHHDDGRKFQYQRTGKLDDNHFSHQDAGAQMLDEFCIAHGTSFANFPKDVLILRNVMLYHGKLDYVDIGLLLPESISYIKAVTTVDELENGMSCISYLKREYDNDEKGLSYEHRISPQVRKCYTKGEKFNKLKYCTTYDEYILFAGMLAINVLKQYGSVAQTLFKKPGFGYSSISIGFYTVFHELLLSEDADWAYSIMHQYIYGN